MCAFAGCSVDPQRREVWRDSELVHLEPQAFDLLEHRDRAVGRAELLDGVWGHVVGGCCGTDHQHVEAIATAVRAR